MNSHPVQFSVRPRGAVARVQVVIRLVLLAAISVVGCASIYWILYLGLPAVVAALVVSKGQGWYLMEGAPRLVRGLRWLAAAYAYLWLLTDELPSSANAGAARLNIVVDGTPTAGSSLLRLVYSLPALLLAAVLSVAAALVWLLAAVAILISERMPVALGDFLTLTLRYQARLMAYHLSLVNRYPSLAEPAAMPAAI